MVYLDDILVFSKFPVDDIAQARRVLTLLYEAGVTLKVKKYKYFTETIDYLGHIIRPGHPKLALRTTDAVTRLKQPTTLAELRFFLDLYNVFWHFLPNYTRLAAYLYEKLRKDNPKQLAPLDGRRSSANVSLKGIFDKPTRVGITEKQGTIHTR